MTEKKYPKIGVGVMILNEKGEALLSLRKGAHGQGEWAFPGGHLEFGETIFETAIREVQEESGLHVHSCELISVSDDFRYIKSDDKHYVTIGVVAKYEGGTPQVMEPEKCIEWKWMALNALPENLFEGTQWIVRAYQSKKIYTPARKV